MDYMDSGIQQRTIRIVEVNEEPTITTVKWSIGTTKDFKDGEKLKGKKI